MRFGLNIFPVVGPREKPAADYYDEALDLCRFADEVGFAFVRTVEHYFVEWGGYVPDPISFLTAVARLTRSLRVVTGAVIPAFNHPIKLAAGLAMLDQLSRGRLDVGFARAFIPDEFAAFEASLSDSRARFEEGIEAVLKLWTSSNFRWEGRFHKFGPLPALLPGPYQRPHPPTFVAAALTSQSFRWAGDKGHHLMTVPSAADHDTVKALLGVYRSAWTAAGRPLSAAQIQLSYHCCVASTRGEALAEAETYFDQYKQKQLLALASWENQRSDQYPGYESMAEQVRNATFTSSLRDLRLLAGTPDDVRTQLEELRRQYGAFDVCFHIGFGNTPLASAKRTLYLLADKVLPAFSGADPRPNAAGAHTEKGPSIDAPVQPVRLDQ